MKRSVGVTVIAVLSLIGSIFTFGMGLIMVAVAVFAPKTDASMPPALFTVMLAGVSLFYFLFAAWGISSSIGLFRLKNWARISTIVFSSLLAILSVFSLPIAFIMPALMKANASADTHAVIVVPIFLGVFWSIHLGIAIWWLVFLTRARVKGQFVSVTAALPEVHPPQIEYQAPESQPLSAQKPRRPVSITVIACLLLAGCLFIPANLLMHAPAIFFTRLLYGWRAALIFLTFATIQLYIGIGLLRLRPTARVVALAYFVFGAVNSAAFFLAPGAGTRMAAFMEWQKSFSAFGQLSSQPQFNFDLTPFYLVMAIVGGVAGLAGMGVQMYFLITRKAAFTQVVAENVVT